MFTMFANLGCNEVVKIILAREADDVNSHSSWIAYSMKIESILVEAMKRSVDIIICNKKFRNILDD